MAGMPIEGTCEDGVEFDDSLAAARPRSRAKRARSAAMPLGGRRGFIGK